LPRTVWRPTPNAPPAAPTGLAASANNAQVSLIWNASTGATSYHVKRSATSGGPYTQVGAPTATNYTDTGLTNGTPYFYVVSAVNSAGESANSTEASATPEASVTQVQVTVDVLADRHPISPYVYGGAYPQDGAHVTDSGMTVVRWGGDATSTYNWQAQTYNAAAAQGPDPQQLFQQADEAQQRGDMQLAVRKYQELIPLHTDMIAARANLGVALVALGRFDEAIAQYHAALTQAPDDPVLRLDLALAWYKQAEFGKAAAELETLRRRQPDHGQSLYLLADCYLRLGRNGDVVKLLEPAYEADPDDRAVDYALGTALIRDGQTQKGERVIDHILKDGNTAEANLLMGAAELAAGDSKSAATAIHQALDRDPKLAGGWSLYGRALVEGGDNEGAKAAFTRAIQADPSNFEVNFHFGRLLRLSGHNAEAAPYLQRALRLRPDSLSARFQVGALNLALGHLDEAQKDLERVARESPDFQEVHVQLAALYYRLHRKQDGERERQIVLRLNQKARQQGPQPEP
jgi:tetratricopeptide (TPR) repeat protein